MSEETTNTQPANGKAPEVAGMTLKQKLRIIVMTLLAILLITFIVQNANRVEVEFLNMNFRVRIIFIILVSALIGSLITFLLMKHRARKKRK